MKKDEFVSNLVLFLILGVLSFVLAVIPYVGPFFSLLASLTLGFGLSWLYGLWPKLFGTIGVFAGLFAASAVKYGVDRITVILFGFQVFVFFASFYAARLYSKREKAPEFLEKDEWQWRMDL
ncbi:MAG: hypothetical protein HYV67_01540 [Candidatus Taylorbacteria bacterium]|nr:hypothetical protein [Candidatus Taylorbacteria bacterium]